jgi:hypothetical protein
MAARWRRPEARIGCLEVFREIMLNPRWKVFFDLVFRAIFDDLGNRLIGPARSALAWERIQAKLGSLIPIGFSQLYFEFTVPEAGNLQSYSLGLPSSLRMH